MSVAVVTGSLGLVGAAVVRALSAEGIAVVGLDSDARAQFFGAAASTAAVERELSAAHPSYRHAALDLRDHAGVAALLARLGRDVAAVVHCAAQPSHDWAAGDPMTDFAVNATGTLNLLEAVRHTAPDAAVVFMSTNKVYGDHPNRLPLAAAPTRFVLPEAHRYAAGIDEGMSIDGCAHSLFGVSKAAADLMVQEYARRFGLFTVVLRAGCITGPGHRATAAHGFLAHLAAVAAAGGTYRVIGHGGLQVRDNLHADDLAAAIARIVARRVRPAVYNIGGGPGATVSVVEALAACERLLGRTVARVEEPTPRFADHMWWVSDTRAFRADHPDWAPRRTVPEMLEELLARPR